MFVSSVNAIRRSPSFGSVTVNPASEGFNFNQRMVCKNIFYEMSVPSDTFNGKSAEKYYEEKGYDFEIYPNVNDEKVTLVACKKDDTKRNSFTVGDYDEVSNKFNTVDIEKRMKEAEIARAKIKGERPKEEKNDANDILLGLLALLGLGTVLTCVSEKQSNNGLSFMETEDTPIELVDTADVEKTPVGTIELSDTAQWKEFD